MSYPAPIIADRLGAVRYLLVVSALSPVFLLWAARGVSSIPDYIWVPSCVGAFLFPNLLVFGFLVSSAKRKSTKTITVSSSTEHQEHLITYLLTMLIPLYQTDISSERGIAAALMAFLFVSFIFWWMRVHYVSIVFALFGFRIFETQSGGGESSKIKTIVITKRSSIAPGTVVTGIRLGSGALLERS
jgi:hypothetical protein